MPQLALPADLAGLYAILANPFAAPVWLSMILEQAPFIKNTLTPNWQKVGAAILLGLAWAVFVSLGNPDGGFTFSAAGIYSIARAGLGVAFLMNVYNKSVENGAPWLKDFFLALFTRTTVVNTAAVKTEDGAATSSSSSASVSTVSAGTPTVLAQKQLQPEAVEPIVGYMPAAGDEQPIAPVGDAG